MPKLFYDVVCGIAINCSRFVEYFLGEVCYNLLMKNILKVLKWPIQKVGQFYHLNLFGVVGGSLGFASALLPSLVPRPALFMGLLAGIGFMVGYGLGILVQKIYYWMIDRKIPRHYSHRTTMIVVWLFGLIMIVFGILANVWQDEIRELVGEVPRSGTGFLLMAIGFVTITTLLLAISRGILKLFRASVRQAQKVKKLPKRVAAVIGSVVALVLLLLIVDGVFLSTARQLANNYFREINETTDDGAVRPTSSLRSGGPGSMVDWQTLGRHGRSFVGQGPAATDIEQFNGREAKEPIRIFVSPSQADNVRDQARLAVQELERTGAFDRKYLIIATPTGSGWIEPASAAAVEYLHDGDTAQVALQYSYLPSWMALLAEKEAATSSGRALFDAVSAKVRSLPADKRPKLILNGLSLGAFGSQSAFTSDSDFALRVDGALYFGNPGFSQPWKYFTQNRDTGSLQIRPVYRGGEVVRFANNHQELLTVGDDWPGTRVLYVQYASDAITWWNPDLIWRKPDWVSESRGVDVSYNVRWFPVITFAQITFDQALGNHFIGGHGHNYAPDVVYSWSAVTPVDWSQDELNRLQDLMNYQYTTVRPGNASP